MPVVSALADSNDDEGSGGGSDSGMEEIDEEIDIEVSSGDSSEDEEEDLSLSQPVKRQLPIKKSVKTQSRGSSKPRHTKHESYDPSKCCKWPN